ncbi:MAG: RlmE family RNA methyltransferase [Thaumarchaeota archaeon]|nr:RlmE family RNA methyltransferase [Nitrososphaerota archaeon]
MRIEEARRDHYRRLAKKEGYRSRAAYKLIEIDEKFGVLKKGYVVIDFGAAPGGWLQVASKRVGPSGLVIGVDLKEIKPLSENVKLLKGDVMDEGISSLLLSMMPRKADLILSDLSPKISGIWSVDHLRQIELCERVLELSQTLLRKNGSMVMKLFEGEQVRDFVGRVRRAFRTVRLFKPKASRKESSEIYLVSLGFVGGAYGPD